MFIRKNYFKMSNDPGVGGGLYDTPPADPSAPPAAGTNPPAPPAGTKASWDSDNWKDLLDEDIKNDPSLKAIKDPKSLAKSYVHGQRMIGADKIVLPGQNATEDEWNGIYSKLGKPESFDKYELKFSETTPVSDDFTKNLKESMFNAGLNQAQAAKIASFWENQVKTSIEKIETEQNAQIAEEIQGLKKEWGPAFDGKIKAAKAAIETFGGPEMFAYMEEHGLHTNTKLARLFAAVGESLVEDGMVPEIDKNSTKTVADLDKAIKENMSNPAYYDATHPNHKNLVRETEELFKRKTGKK